MLTHAYPNTHTHTQIVIVSCSMYRLKLVLTPAPTGATAVLFAQFGQGTGRILLDNVACRGSEARLINCGHNAIGVHNCIHAEDAGVRCQRECFRYMKQIGSVVATLCCSLDSKKKNFCI